MNNRQENDEATIDLLELFYVLKKKILIILGAFVAGIIIMAVYTMFFVTPIYSATTKMYMISESTVITSVADLQLGTQLTPDYSALVKSRPVLEQVIENLGLNMSAGQLGGSLSIENPSGTRILSITVTHPVPETAQKLANEVASVSADKVSEIMAAEKPKIYEEALKPTSPISPSIKKNCALGGIAAIVIACGIIIVMYLMNDTIKSEDDIEKYLGITTLGVIPEKLKKKGKKKKTSKNPEVSSHD